MPLHRRTRWLLRFANVTAVPNASQPPPPWLINGIEHLRAGLGHLRRSTIPASVAMRDIAQGAWLTQALFDLPSVVAKAGPLLDASALTILRKLRTAMAPTGMLLLPKLVLPEGTPWYQGMLIDLEMLVTARGRERTAPEYAELLSQAGFRQTRVVPTAGPMSIVEALPV